MTLMSMLSSTNEHSFHSAQSRARASSTIGRETTIDKGAAEGAASGTGTEATVAAKSAAYGENDLLIAQHSTLLKTQLDKWTDVSKRDNKTVISKTTHLPKYAASFQRFLTDALKKRPATTPGGADDENDDTVVNSEHPLLSHVKGLDSEAMEAFFLSACQKVRADERKKADEAKAAAQAKKAAADAAAAAAADAADDMEEDTSDTPKASAGRSGGKRALEANFNITSIANTAVSSQVPRCAWQQR